ncbi:MAG TPA: HAMP domain-containing sensor histidine kinase [Thermoanaerobaculia bacterium]|nr:HAMP domain-containing sensor histidine kinase [Thermoanaerobaculia bacterium]
MNRRRPSRAALIGAASVVVAVLAALVVLPLLLSVRIDHYRANVEAIAQPSRDDLNRVNNDLGHEIASLSRYAITRDAKFIDGYRREVAMQQRSMSALAAHVRVLGEGASERFADLQTKNDAWHSAVESWLTNSRVAGNQMAYEADYPSVVEAVAVLDESITAYQTAQRNEMAQVIHLHTRLAGILVLLALAAAATVVWLVLRLRTLTDVLEKESDRRLAALRSRDEVLGIVSHDLRSPLTTIMLSTQLLEGSPAEEQREHVETILSTTRRMQRLIQDLLDVTRIENAALSIKHEAVDAAELANEVIASHAPIAAQKHIVFQPSIDSSLPRVNGDRDRLLQALGNLLGNAFKFTPESGTVRFVAQRFDGGVRFSVIDSGPGIPDSDLPHLFEPFWQSKKTAHLGAGLGLKITRAIVEAHGGSIHVTNEPGGGACFAFDLPLMADDRVRRRDE